MELSIDKAEFAKTSLEQISEALKSVFALSEAYPELGSNNNFLKLQERISGLENEIADRRELYNESVNNYNIRIQSLPDMFIANTLGLPQEVMFKVDENKKKDIDTLYALGASKKVIRWIFLSVGMIIAFIGASLGLTLGLIISGLQQKYGFVSMGMQSALITAYPVIISISDVLLTTFAIFFISLLATIQPTTLATKNLSPQS